MRIYQLFVLDTPGYGSLYINLIYIELYPHRATVVAEIPQKIDALGRGI